MESKRLVEVRQIGGEVLTCLELLDGQSFEEVQTMIENHGGPVSAYQHLSLDNGLSFTDGNTVSDIPYESFIILCEIPKTAFCGQWNVVFADIAVGERCPALWTICPNTITYEFEGVEEYTITNREEEENKLS